MRLLSVSQSPKVDYIHTVFEDDCLNRVGLWELDVTLELQDEVLRVLQSSCDGSVSLHGGHYQLHLQHCIRLILKSAIYTNITHLHT